MAYTRPCKSEECFCYVAAGVLGAVHNLSLLFLVYTVWAVSGFRCSPLHMHKHLVLHASILCKCCLIFLGCRLIEDHPLQFTCASRVIGLSTRALVSAPAHCSKSPSPNVCACSRATNRAFACTQLTPLFCRSASLKHDRCTYVRSLAILCAPPVAVLPRPEAMNGLWPMR